MPSLTKVKIIVHVAKINNKGIYGQTITISDFQMQTYRHQTGGNKMELL